MDFVTRKIDGKIRIATSRGHKKDVIELQRIKIEFYLFCLLGALWNKYFVFLPNEDKEKVIRKVRRPSIGSIIDCISILDDGSKEILNGRDKIAKLQEYTRLRNAKIGHGYIIGDTEDEVLKEITSLSSYIYTNMPFIHLDKSIIVVDEYAEKMATGIRISPTGEIHPWIKDEADEGFHAGAIFVHDSNKYFKVDPFIRIESEDDVYLFKDISDLLSGAATMNNIFTGKAKIMNSVEFRNPQFEDGANRVVRFSGTVSNKYSNNFEKYINIGVVKKRILEFITKDRASVSATIWGHGGVGKTALVQSVLDDLYNLNDKYFDYAVFASAKNVLYNIKTGQIDEISSDVTTFNDLISRIGSVMFPQDDFDAELILDSQSRLLLIIDDFETFQNDEKKKIAEYIAKMDIDRHKVFITTRAHIGIGVEFPTNELSKQEAKRFLEETIKSNFDSRPLIMSDFLSKLDSTSLDNIYEITGGRPLFILQLFAAWKEFGDLSQVIGDHKGIQASESAIQFLYGRIFDYLSPSAKKVFMTIGALIDGSDEPNLLAKVAFASNMSDDEFEIALNELVKLKMIELIDAKFFRSYSKELAKMMTGEFYKSTSQFQQHVSAKIALITKDRNLDIYSALLQNANALRGSAAEDKVVQDYISLINESKADENIRFEAIKNLANYLSDRGKPSRALDVLKNYHDKLKNIPEYVILLADFCTRMNDRGMSVEYLREYIREKPKPYWDRDEVRLEMSFLLMLYKTSQDLDARNALFKSSRATDDDKAISNEQMRTSIQSGLILVNQLKTSKNISSLSSRAQQNILAGLGQFVEMCSIMYRLEEAIDTCKFALRNFPTQMTRDLSRRLRYAERKLESRSYR